MLPFRPNKPLLLLASTCSQTQPSTSMASTRHLSLPSMCIHFAFDTTASLFPSKGGHGHHHYLPHHHSKTPSLVRNGFPGRISDLADTTPQPSLLVRPCSSAVQTPFKMSAPTVSSPSASSALSPTASSSGSPSGSVDSSGAVQTGSDNVEASAPKKRRSRVSPDDPARAARLAARAVRNRASAQNSRNRKKAEHDALEVEVVDLRERNGQLEAKVCEMDKSITALMHLVQILMKNQSTQPQALSSQSAAIEAASKPANQGVDPANLNLASFSSPSSSSSSMPATSSHSPSPVSSFIAAPTQPASLCAPSLSPSSPSMHELPASNPDVRHPAVVTTPSSEVAPQRTSAIVNRISLNANTEMVAKQSRMQRVTTAAAMKSRVRSRMNQQRGRGQDRRLRRSKELQARATVSQGPSPSVALAPLPTSTTSTTASQAISSRASLDSRTRRLRLRIVYRPRCPAPPRRSSQ